MKTQIKKILPKIILGIIILFALFFRLYQIDKSVWLQSGYDESRDMLVAKHIVTYKENVYIGPLAAGGMNWLQNSPVYYYFISIIWFFTRKPLFFMYVWAIIMTTPVLIGYFIGKKAKDQLTGIILAALLAINHQMIYSSRELLQTHLSLIFSTIFIWSIISYLKSKEDVKYLLISIVALLLPLHFHYGVFIALPIGISFVAYYLFVENKKNKIEPLVGILTPIVIFISVLWSWVILTYRSFPFDQIYFLTKNFNAKYNLPLLEQLQKVMETLSKMIGGNYFSITMSVVFLVILLFLTKKIIIDKKYKKIFIFITSMCMSVLFCIFYKHYVAETYLLFIFPFFLVLIALVMRLLIDKKPILGWALTIFSIYMMFNFSIKNIFVSLPSNSFHNQQMELSKNIYEDYIETNLTAKQDQPDLLISWYTTTRNMPFDGWGTSGVWYYLEENFQKKLVNNTSYGLNHTPINKYPQVIYMVCDYRLDKELIQEECINRFKKSYLITEGSIKKINDSENLSLWSARLKNGKIKTTTNVVHRELLLN